MEIVKSDTQVKRKQGQQPKWTKWVRMLDEVLNEEHPVGMAVVWTDKQVVDEVNSRLAPEDRISMSSLERYKRGGHIQDESIESLFVMAYQKALRIQAQNLQARMVADVPGGWQKWAWILERKFDEWNLRSKVVDETPEVGRLVFRVDREKQSE